jgi:hypothetical protein
LRLILTPPSPCHFASAITASGKCVLLLFFTLAVQVLPVAGSQIVATPPIDLNRSSRLLQFPN